MSFNNVWLVLAPDKADFLKQLLTDIRPNLCDKDQAKVNFILDILAAGDTRDA